MTPCIFDVIENFFPWIPANIAKMCSLEQLTNFTKLQLNLKGYLNIMLMDQIQ